MINDEQNIVELTFPKSYIIPVLKQLFEKLNAYGRLLGDFFIKLHNLKISLKASLVILMISFCTNIYVASVQGVMPFHDDFADLTNWNIVDGTWSLESGSLHGSSDGEGLIVSIGGDTNYIVETAATVMADSPIMREATIVVRYIDPNNFYWMGIGNWGHFASISRKVNGVTEELITVGLGSDVVFGQMYTLKAVVIGNNLQFYVDGVLTVEVEDASHSSGAVGFRIWGSHSRFEYIDVSQPPQVAIPNLDPPGGTYSSSQAITISCDTSGATICYTTNEVDPTSSSAVYSSPISVSSGSVTIKAMAFKKGMIESDIVSATYTIEISPVDTTPPDGMVVISGGAEETPSTSVTLTLEATDPESGVALMHFSNDGETWTDWESFTTSKTWTLPSGDGTKEVYVQFQNGASPPLESIIYSDTIELHTGGPVDTDTFLFWIAVPIVIVIIVVIVGYYYLKKRKTNHKPSRFDKISGPLQQRTEEKWRGRVLKNIADIHAKCDDTIKLLNNFIEEPTLKTDRRAWDSLSEFIAVAEKIEDDYAELIETRNTIARLRIERNQLNKAGLFEDASKIQGTIQNNYYDLIRLIRKIREKLPKL